MKRVPLTRGKYAVVDDSDFCSLCRFKWIALWNGKKWYAVTWVGPRGNQKCLYMHRVLLSTPKGFETDHWDGNGLNNRRANLRVATHHQNQGNRKPTRHSSRYKGVFACRRSGNWRAAIVLNGKQFRLGHFSTQKGAALAYDKKAVELFGEFAKTNF